MIVNRYAKKCQSCDKKVGIGEGFAYKNGYTWLTVCNSTACHERLGVKAEGPEASRRLLLADGTIKMPYDREAIPVIKGMPGAKFNPAPSNTWTVSVKDADLPHVLTSARFIELEIAQELLDREAAGSDIEREAEARSNNDKLYPFQKDGVKFLVMHERALLADDMGLGKTLQTIISLPKNARVFITCPASLKYNWQNEFNKWKPEFKTTVLSGKGAFKLPEENEAVIVNYDILPDWLIPEEIKNGDKKEYKLNIEPETLKALKHIHFVGDECQHLKNYNTKKHKKVKTLTKDAKTVKFLSGSPLDNRPPDLYGVLSAGNMFPFGGWAAYVKAFNGMKGTFGGYEWGMPGPEVPEKLKRVMLRRLKKDVLTDLPAKTYSTVTTDVSGQLKKDLDKVLKDMKKEFGFDEGSDDDFITTIAPKLPSFEQFSKIRAKLAKDRIPAALEIIETYEESGTPLVVFSAHKEPVETIGKREGWTYITGDITDKKRQEAVDSFQAGKLKGIAITIIAGGEGITLTHASHELFIDRDWRVTKNLQAEDRCHRIGQKSNVSIMTMVSDHILDTHINNLLQYKIELINKTLESQVQYKPLRKKAQPELLHETREELLARMESAEKEAEEKEATSLVHSILAREQARSKLPEPELTVNRKELIRNALEFMVGRCDGAHTKDGQGFNKPDAAIAHWIFATGMRNDDQITYRVTERILSRYYKQLNNNYQEIWNPGL